MTQPITIEYCKAYIKGLEDFLMVDIDKLSIEEKFSLEDRHKILQELKQWKNTLRVLQTVKYGRPNYEFTSRKWEILKHSKVDNIKKVNGHALELREDK